MNVRSGLEGPVRKVDSNQPTSGLHSPEVIGQGPPQETDTGNSLVFGDIGGGRPRKIQTGSPEHHMLSEAKVISRGNHSQEPTEARMRKDSSLKVLKEKDPAGRRKGYGKSQDSENGRPEGGGDLKSLPPGKERENMR